MMANRESFSVWRFTPTDALNKNKQQTNPLCVQNSRAETQQQDKWNSRYRSVRTIK